MRDLDTNDPEGAARLNEQLDTGQLPPLSVRTLERQERAVAWELRGHWIRRRPIVLTLSDRCLVDRVVGVVEHVAVTGAFVLIDGWHVPTVDVLGVATAHHTQSGVVRDA